MLQLLENLNKSSIVLSVWFFLLCAILFYCEPLCGYLTVKSATQSLLDSVRVIRTTTTTTTTTSWDVLFKSQTIRDELVLVLLHLSVKTYSLIFFSEPSRPGSYTPFGRCWMSPIRWAMRTCSSSVSWVASRAWLGVGW